MGRPSATTPILTLRSLCCLLWKTEDLTEGNEGNKESVVAPKPQVTALALMLAAALTPRWR